MDGVRTENISQDTSTRQGFEKSSSFRSFLAKLRNRFSRKSIPNKKEVNPEQYAEFINEYEDRKPTLNSILYEKLQKKGLVVPEFKSEGASGFFGTNERINPEKLKAVRETKQPPNGYLIGIGISNIFSLLDTFPANIDPKGIVMVNIDPKAVEDAKIFVKKLKEGKVMCSDSPNDIYNPETQSRYKERSRPLDPYNQGLSIVDTSEVLRNHAEKLIRLAREGKIAVLQQDILNPDVLREIGELPEFKKSRNVVYLSNIADWIRRAGIWGDEGIMMMYHKFKVEHSEAESLPREQVISHWSKLFRNFDNLGLLEPNEPNVNYYVDTSDRWSGEDYYSLRFRIRHPKYDLNTGLV